ncbi:MAG TPA: hypothetical protein VF092_07040 [Longimicrobium sp.]
MTARPAAGLLLIPFAAVCLVASACSRDVIGSGDALTSPAGLRGDVSSGSTAPTGGTTSGGTTTGGTTTTTEDSVISGYGSPATGGIEYETFEYDPATGTEYVATPDTPASSKSLTSTETTP